MLTGTVLVLVLLLIAQICTALGMQLHCCTRSIAVSAHQPLARQRNPAEPKRNSGTAFCMHTISADVPYILTLRQSSQDCSMPQ